MLRKYLILILVLPNFAIAAANVVGLVKTDTQDMVEVEWKWNNQIVGGLPFSLIATPINWSILNLALKPGKSIVAKASHVNPPHGEGIKTADLCYILGTDPKVRANFPKVGDLAVVCGVSIYHNANNKHYDHHQLTIVPPANVNDDWSVTWTGVHCIITKSAKSISTTDSPMCFVEPPLPLSLELISFQSTSIGTSNYLSWVTFSEINHAGFYLWRATQDQGGSYKPTLLSEFGHSEQVNPEPDENCSSKIQGQLETNDSNQPLQLISAINNSAENTCYSFTDTSNLNDGTYYYLLEDISDDGKSTFHCDHLDAVTVGQGLAIDLESAINYCKEVTGSNN